MALIILWQPLGVAPNARVEPFLIKAIPEEAQERRDSNDSFDEVLSVNSERQKELCSPRHAHGSDAPLGHFRSTTQPDRGIFKIATVVILSKLGQIVIAKESQREGCEAVGSKQRPLNFRQVPSTSKKFNDPWQMKTLIMKPWSMKAAVLWAASRTGEFYDCGFPYTLLKNDPWRPTHTCK